MALIGISCKFVSGANPMSCVPISRGGGSYAWRAIRLVISAPRRTPVRMFTPGPMNYRSYTRKRIANFITFRMSHDNSTSREHALITSLPRVFIRPKLYSDTCIIRELFFDGYNFSAFFRRFNLSRCCSSKFYSFGRDHKLRLLFFLLFRFSIQKKLFEK